MGLGHVMKKTQHLLFALSIAVSIRIAAGAQRVPWSAREEPVRWHRYTYNINSEYPYLKELPEWSQIPVLLEWITKENDDAGVDVAYSQLVALSRTDFKHPLRPPEGGLPSETLNYYKEERSAAWARWWSSSGQNYGKRLGTHGRQNAEAWKLVIREGSHPVPDYKVTIPGEWTLRTSYRAGDYDGMQTESLTLRRSKEKATLVRALRKSTWGPLEWERWEPLSIEQADNFAFAMAYAIDHPWLVLKSNRDTTRDSMSRRLEGRSLTIYYPSFHNEFADMDGNVWWNDDPSHWRSGWTPPFTDTWGLGSICLLLWRSFPENSPANTSPGQRGKWSALKMPDTAVFQVVAEDLVLRGEIIEALRNFNRMSDGLETLAEFGTPEQLSAITKLESELPRRLEKVKAILAEDSNGGNLRTRAERLLSDAAKAKAAIRNRSAR